MSLKFNPYSVIIFVTGKKGMGKSYFVRFLIKGIKRRILFDVNWEHGETGYIVHSIGQLKKAFLFNDLTNIVYQPMNFTDEEFNQLCLFIMTLSNVLFIVEEVQRNAHERGYTSQAFREIVNRGRHQGIGLIGLSRRPAIIHKDIRGNADYVVCFQLHEDKDVEYMANWLGCKEDDIKSLPEYYSIVYNTLTHEINRNKPC